VSDPTTSRPGAHVALETTEPVGFGYGFISGLASAILGIAAFGMIVSLRFPDYLAFAELRSVYSSPYLRVLIHLTLVTAFLLGSISAILRSNKALALTGLAFTLAAALLGGSQVKADNVAQGDNPWLAVDFFVLSLVLYSAVFIPLERLFALRPEQPVFRRHWIVDLTYFFINSLLVEVLTIFTLQPALVLFDWARIEFVGAAIASVPIAGQVLLILLVADGTQYWVHRTFHAVPLLWRFHAIHHSAEEMDWLAGSRLHLLDVIVTRGITYVPIFVLGFSNGALMVYVFLVAAQATFIHANVRWRFRRVRHIFATPAFHHWHHSADREAVDKNFAVHTPVWDLLFGTYYLPDAWPLRYGLTGDRKTPSGWLRQLVHPLRTHRAESTGDL
jgi:sterol desaturase/sphingolipid hydroxylase (fatty acid hydroxylase superfamily)